MTRKHTAALMAAAHAAPVPGQGTWQTTLQARDLNGDTVTDAFYDTVLNITWLRNANANGRMNWNQANAWATNLTFGGYSDWRLPTMVDTGAPGGVISQTNPGSYAGGTDYGYNVQTSSGSTVYSEMFDPGWSTRPSIPMARGSSASAVGTSSATLRALRCTLWLCAPAM